MMMTLGLKGEAEGIVSGNTGKFMTLWPQPLRVENYDLHLVMYMTVHQTTEGVTNSKHKHL